MLDGIFRGNKEQVDEYSEALNEIMVTLDDGTRVVPEFYYVPKDKVSLINRHEDLIKWIETFHHHHQRGHLWTMKMQD